MKRILQITAGLYRNGTETFIMNVFRNIDRSQVTFDFLLLNHTDDGYEQEAKELGAELHFYPSRTKNIFKYRRFLHKFFKQNAGKYDAVHFNGNSFTELYPVKVARKYGIPIRIVHSHNSSTSGWHNRMLHNLNRKKLGHTATHYLACSEAAREWGFKGSDVYSKSRIIPNGIYMEAYTFNPILRRKKREEFNIAEDAFVICNTGAFRAVKNHPTLIRIFKEIKAKEINAKLLLCGAGDTEQRIKEMVRDEGLEDSVIFLGLRSDIGAVLSASDVMVFPSFYEGLPFALIEAQANQLPVIASDTIPSEIKLSDNICFLPLEAGPSVWAEKALSLWNPNRFPSPLPGKLKAYDIKLTCELLTKLYSQNPDTSSTT